MSDKKRKVPKLRFPGFTDAWEQRKLGNLVNTVKYKDYIVEANESGLYPVIQQGDRPILGYSNSDPITQFEDLVVFGDHTLSLFNPQSPFLLASDGVKVIRIPNFTGEFTYYILERYLPISQGYKRHYSVLKMQEVFFPAEYSERDRIGEFISMFDSLISLHQRKLDNVKMLKKSLLQKLFPKDGEKIPELRFPGFTDDWEQRKVGDFLTESRVKGSNGKVSKKLTVKLWGKGVVEKNTTYHGSEATQYYTRFSGQFIYGKLDFLNQAFGIIPEELDGYESTLDSPAFDVSPALNKDFFLDYVSREQFYLVQGIIANGSRKAKRIHSDTFFEMPILLPEFNEQKVISDFTSKFDSLISLHQRKLDHLKELKKGLLQQMFV